jgi:hypothetical protein
MTTPAATRSVHDVGFGPGAVDRIVLAELPAAPRRWGRVKELRPLFGLTKPWAFSALKAGKIRAKKLNGVLLVDLDSVRTLIEQAPDWSPKPKDANGPVTGAARKTGEDDAIESLRRERRRGNGRP